MELRNRVRRSFSLICPTLINTNPDEIVSSGSRPSSQSASGRSLSHTKQVRIKGSILRNGRFVNKKTSSNLSIIGWREWVGLPDLCSKRIKAKVDTGARSSSLHATNIQEFEKDGVAFVRFRIHPYHRNPAKHVSAESKVMDFRMVKSSSGKATNRPVILAYVTLLGESWPVELTLANRNEMGFRMLLGREAFRNRFLVDSSKSYYGGRPKRKKRPK